MGVTAIVLGALAVALAWPVPTMLARARWPVRRPAVGLLVWQTIGLAGGLALLATELALAGIDSAGWSGRGRADGSWIRTVLDPARLGVAGWIGLIAFGLTSAWLVAVLVTSTIRVAAARRRHRYVLDLLAERDPDGVPADVSVLTHASTAAYSVPGRRPRIVVSQGACDSLGRIGLQAVVEHERAHLRQHHDVVVQPFVAWRRSFPFLPATTMALRAVEELTEYLADDAARVRVGAGPLRDALGVMDGPHDTTAVRQRRLIPTSH